MLAGSRSVVVGHPPKTVSALCLSSHWDYCSDPVHLRAALPATDFWCDCLGLLEVDKGSSPVPFITVSTGADQATLRLAQLPEGEQITHGTG